MTDLRLLRQQLKLSEGGAGKAVVISGRRRVGKSLLAQVLCDRSRRPYLVFQATRGRLPNAERADFISAIEQSNLAGRDLVHGTPPGDWNHCLRTLAMAVPDDSPSIVVIDEVPWLIEQDREFEGALQTVWDRHLAHKPILLLLIGSDLSVMEALQEYGRPFHGRAAHHILMPLNAADVAELTNLAPPEAIDAYLITGGFPEIARSWQPEQSRLEFLQSSFANPLSPLLMAGRLSMLGEFPEPAIARSVLEAIGSGERTFSTIAAKAGGGGQLPSGTLSPVLTTLTNKRAIAVDLPLSTRHDEKNKRYRIEDTYLRFWHAFLRMGIPEVERGRPDLALARVERSWTSWRGRAVEPWVRSSLSRLLPDRRWPQTNAVGGWWNRQNNPEVDLVGADGSPTVSRVDFAGSIKWHDNQPFTAQDYAQLLHDSMFVPGAGDDVPLVAASRSGVEKGLPIACSWGPSELVEAWS